MKSIAAPGVDCRLGHVMMGAASAFMPAGWAVLAGTIFAGYELLRAKPEHAQMKALAEWAGGFLVGFFLRQMT